MRERQFSTFLTVMVLVALFTSGPDFAGRVMIGLDEWTAPECDQTTDEECSDEATAGPDGGPKHCNWPTAQSGSAYLSCLGGEVCGEDSDGDGFDVGVDVGQQNNMPNMNFWLDQTPGCTPPGAITGPLEEVFSYCLRETGDVIGYALIEVEQPNLVAKIHKFVEKPGRTGQITIGIDEHPDVVVDVGPALQSVDKLNKIVCTALGVNFRAACLDDFFVVYADHEGQTPQTLSLSTAGSGVSTTEIALEPNGGNPDITACSESSPPEPLTISPR